MSGPRIDQLVARNLEISRREARSLLRARRIRSPHGDPMADGSRVNPEAIPLRVDVDGEPLVLRDRVHVLQHKPVGTVTAHKDPVHPTAWELLRAQNQPLVAELRAVGRLDLDACGLLLWTTDGSLVHRLTHPKKGIVREYHVALAGAFQPPPSDLRFDDGYAPRLLGVEALERDQLHPALPVPEEAIVFASIALASGRFHEVKRIFGLLGTQVLSLCRVSHAGLQLPPDLEPGGALLVDLDGVDLEKASRPHV